MEEGYENLALCMKGDDFKKSAEEVRALVGKGEGMIALEQEIVGSGRRGEEVKRWEKELLDAINVKFVEVFVDEETKRLPQWFGRNHVLYRKAMEKYAMEVDEVLVEWTTGMYAIGLTVPCGLGARVAWVLRWRPEQPPWPLLTRKIVELMDKRLEAWKEGIMEVSVGYL